MKYIDLHQDLKLSIERPELLSAGHLRNPQTNFLKLKNNNVAVVLCTGFPMPDDGDFFKKENFAALVSDIKWYQAYSDGHPEWMLVRSKADIDTCLKTNTHGILFHLEGINMFDGAQTDWEVMNTLYELGLRSLALTWSKSNSLAGGNDEPLKGITQLGHELIEWSLEKKVAVDLAHLSRTGFSDFSERYTVPLLVSHGAVNALCANDRNYTDEQLKTVGDSGGCFGVFFSQNFLTKKTECSIDDAVRHLQHVKDVAGSDAVALGSDFGGIVSGTPQELSSLDDLSMLTQKLISSGWTEDECEKMAYKNAARVLKSYL